MIIRNKLDNAFGPVGTSAGIFLLIAGLIITFFALSGLIFIVLGAFVGFTSTSTAIDFDNGRLRFSNNIFGIFPIGQWVLIQRGMKIGIKKSNKVWRAYSLSNRSLDISNNDYRIILYDPDGKAIMPIQKSDNIHSLRSDLDKYSKELKVEIT
jgi:hypothetical protein